MSTHRETARKLTLDEAQDIAASLAADYYASDDLRALCQFVGLLDADPIEALEAERAAHQATAQRAANDRALEIRRLRGEPRTPDLAGLRLAGAR